MSKPTAGFPGPPANLFTWLKKVTLADTAPHKNARTSHDFASMGVCPTFPTYVKIQSLCGHPQLHRCTLFTRGAYSPSFGTKPYSVKKTRQNPKPQRAAIGIRPGPGRSRTHDRTCQRLLQQDACKYSPDTFLAGIIGPADMEGIRTLAEDGVGRLVPGGGPWVSFPSFLP